MCVGSRSLFVMACGQLFVVRGAFVTRRYRMRQHKNSFFDLRSGRIPHPSGRCKLRSSRFIRVFDHIHIKTTADTYASLRLLPLPRHTETDYILYDYVEENPSPSSSSSTWSSMLLSSQCQNIEFDSLERC